MFITFHFPHIYCHHVQGSVKLSVYKTYFRSVGFSVSMAILISLIIAFTFQGGMSPPSLCLSCKINETLKIFSHEPFDIHVSSLIFICAVLSNLWLSRWSDEADTDPEKAQRESGLTLCR
jgi:hypothetical protein